jgi:hypothetical protein
MRLAIVLSLVLCITGVGTAFAQCEGKPNGTACDDDDFCTVDDFCDDGVCVGVPIDCDDGDPCTADSCDPATGGCVNAPIDCDDDNPCTIDYCTQDGCHNDPAPVGTPCPGGECDESGICDAVVPIEGVTWAVLKAVFR